MKKILLSLTTLFLIQTSFSQNVRYYDKIFNDVKIDTNIKYGENYTYDALQGESGLYTEDQLLDIYQPMNDSETNRPLIIWAHGGSFLSGVKEDPDIVYFCNEFAKRGFVTASIAYRLGYEQPIDSVNAVRAVYRALQDGRAAVRYMRSIADSLNIDPNRIYFGGTSAGAFIALNIAYFNLPTEVPDYLDTNERLSVNTIPGFGLDGIEGLTNAIPESSEIQGIINFCGATKTVSWMDDEYSRSVPVISMHGTNDGTVPYATRVINVNDIAPIPAEPVVPIVEVQGSYDIDKHADTEGYTSRFYTWYGADHVPYINFHSDSISALYMDTLMQFTVKHVYEDFLKLGSVPGISENDPPCDFNNGDTLPCVSGIGEFTSKSLLSIYPNPGKDALTLQNQSNQKKLITFYNIMQQKVEEVSIEPNSHVIVNTTHLKSGVYMLSSKDKVYKWIKQ